MDDKQKELATTGLGLVALGAGSTFALLPRFSARQMGMQPDATEQAGSFVAVRGLGFRDLAFGLGLLATRQQPAKASLLLKLLALCMAGDTIACFLAIRKPGSTVFTFLGGLASIVTGLTAWIVAQEKKS